MFAWWQSGRTALVPGWLFADGDGGAGGSDGAREGAGDDTAGKGKDDQPGGAADAGGDKGGGEKVFTQADVDRLIGERLKREREAQEKKEREAEEQRKAEEAKQQGEWQKLAEQHEGKVKELTAALETATAELEGLKKIVQAQLDEGLKALPKDVLDLDLVPGEDRPLTERLAGLAKAQAVAARIKGGSNTPGTPQNEPKKTGAAGAGQSDEEARRGQKTLTQRGF